jgi:hypothetical protein
VVTCALNEWRRHRPPAVAEVDAELSERRCYCRPARAIVLLVSDTDGQQTRRSVSEVTRRNILDRIRLSKLSWWGVLDEVDFLARLYDLSAMPSTDRRFDDAAADIFQHRLNNLDWDDVWVFADDRFGLRRGDDEKYLRFLCEMLHPVVRPDPDQVASLRAMFNEQLLRDGWELYSSTSISGYPVFAARRVSASGNRAVASLKGVAERLGTAEYIAQQITRIEAGIDSDPALAIGTAKELIETVCKSILADRGERVDGSWEIPRLVKETARVLELMPDKVDDAKRGAEAIRRILGSLASIGTGLAELRNLYGTGHGKAPTTRGLTARHAHLAVGAATTLVVFLHQTHLSRPCSA